MTTKFKKLSLTSVYFLKWRHEHKKLTYLYVINNKLTELASITKLTKLEKLYAGGNNIQVNNM